MRINYAHDDGNHALELVKKALREAGCSAGIWSLYSVNRKFWLGFDIVGVLGRERRTPLSSAWRVCISTRAKATWCLSKLIGWSRLIGNELVRRVGTGLVAAEGPADTRSTAEARGGTSRSTRRAAFGADRRRGARADPEGAGAAAKGG